MNRRELFKGILGATAALSLPPTDLAASAADALIFETWLDWRDYQAAEVIHESLSLTTFRAGDGLFVCRCEFAILPTYQRPNNGGPCLIRVPNWGTRASRARIAGNITDVIRYSRYMSVRADVHIWGDDSHA